MENVQARIMERKSAVELWTMMLLSIISVGKAY
jgi:hypothetical protein